MESETLKNQDLVISEPKPTTSAQIVTVDAVQAEGVPTIPLGSLEMISELQPEISVHSVASTLEVSTPAPLVMQPAEYHRNMDEWLRLWWDGIRPAYLPLSLMPALVGSALAWTQTITARTPLGHFRLPQFLFALLAICLLQMGAHLINDYYDYLRGIDTGNALGPSGLIQQGLIKPSRVLTCGLILLGSGVIVGSVVALAGGPLIYLIGLLGLCCAYFYSATSYAFSSLGLSEVVAFGIFGPLITLGAYMLQAGQVWTQALVYSLPLGLLAAAVVHANNMRDIEGDAHAKKHTLATILGLGRSRIWFLILLLSPYAIMMALGIPHNAPHLVLITLWTLPVLLVIITGILRTNTFVGYHLVMLQTLKLEIYFGLLLVAALVGSALFVLLPHIPTNFLPM